MIVSNEPLIEEEVDPFSHAKLFVYQERAVTNLLTRQHSALLAEMGTGKTRITLEYLRRINAQRPLVICPLSVGGVWQLEAIEIDFHLPVSVVMQGSIEQRVRALKAWMVLRPSGMIVINYDSFWRTEMLSLLQKWKPDAIIADEASKLKNRTTKQSKYAHVLARMPSVQHRLGLTGTPITNGIHDLFSIFKFISPDVFGTNWSHFASEYLIYGGYENRVITGYRNEDKARAIVAKNAFQISKSEAIDLPERVDAIIPVMLTPASVKRYEQFRKDAIAQLEGFDTNGNPLRGQVLARTALTQLLRLQQLTGGHVQTESGHMDVSQEKIDTTFELTSQAIENGEQVVIFCRFRREIDRLKERLTKNYSIGVLNGDVEADERNRLVAAFQAHTLKVLVCQIRVAAMGLNLTAGSVGIFVSQGYSLEDTAQARDRLHRIGQKRRVTYYFLHAVLPENKETVDGKIYKAIQNKQQLAGKVVSLDYVKELLG